MISGFTSGIGVIIIVLQTLPLLGLATEQGTPTETIRVWPEAVGEINWSAFTVAAVTLTVGVLWPRRLRVYLPAAGLPRCGIQALDTLRHVPADHFVETLDEARELAYHMLTTEKQ